MWEERVREWLPEMYLVVALSLTMVMVWVTPPFFGPDEAAQSLRAEMLAHGGVVAHVGESGEAGALTDDGLIEAAEGFDSIRMDWEKRAGFFLDRRWGAVSAARQKELAGVRWTGHQEFEAFGNTAVYPPALYGPSVVGWKVGEAARWTLFGTLRLARLLCALTAVLMGWMALRLCLAWRWQVFGFLTLPSVLFLDATSSQDPVMLSAAALVVALLGRAVIAKREFSWGELVTVAGLLGAMGMARPPYLAMAMVLFLPSAEVRRGWLRVSVALGLVLVAASAWWRLMAGFDIDHNDIAEPALQRAFIAAHPLAAGAAVMRGTVEAGWDFLRRGTYVVGWNDLLPHHGAALVLAACLLVLTVSGAEVGVRSRLGVAFLFAAVAGPLLGISLAEYVIWSRPGMATVWGILPRYWLPVLPLGMVLVARLLRWRMATRASVMSVGMIVFVACTLPWMAAHAFYREGLGVVLRLNWR